MRERSFVTAAGVELHVASSPPIGPPVVLLHGVTRRWQDWLGVIPWLSPRWEVAALDFRGHGLSRRTPGAYRIADYVPDVVDFLRRGLTEPAILIGHSLGGNVAAGVAAAAPDRVRAVVLEDPPLEMAGERIVETPFLETFRVFVKHAGSGQSVAAIAAEMADAIVTLPNRPGPSRLGEFRDVLSLRSSAASLKRLDPEVLEVPIAKRWLDGSDVLGDLGRIACPALLLAADFSLGGALPDDVAERSASLLPEGVLVKLPGVGHNVHASALDAMMRAVLPFLGSLE